MHFVVFFTTRGGGGVAIGEMDVRGKEDESRGPLTRTFKYHCCGGLWRIFINYSDSFFDS